MAELKTNEIQRAGWRSLHHLNWSRETVHWLLDDIDTLLAENERLKRQANMVAGSPPPGMITYDQLVKKYDDRIERLWKALKNLVETLDQEKVKLDWSVPEVSLLELCEARESSHYATVAARAAIAETPQ